MPFEQHLRDFAVKKPCAGQCPTCKTHARAKGVEQKGSDVAARAGEDGAGELYAMADMRDAEMRDVEMRREGEGLASLKKLTPAVERRLSEMLRDAFVRKVGA
jgi:hypothetical protein